MNVTFSIRIPGEWGPHVRTVIVIVVILVAMAAGVDVASLLPVRV
ncbi:hypothetical protein [Nonomuraea cavernae]